ncbi:MAG TPA: hypothetical protein VIM11_07915 [Tepidisphaeraceae bacterium]
MKFIIRIGLVAAHALALGIAALVGWSVFAFVIVQVSTSAGTVAVICLFLAWQFLLTWFAAGALLGGAVVNAAELPLGILLGVVLGNFGGWAVAGYGGMCFGTTSGFFVGAAAGLFRRRFVPGRDGMNRPLHNLASALSLFLCAVTLVLWVRDHASNERVSWVNAGGTVNWWFNSSGGMLFGCWTAYTSRQLDDPGLKFEREEGAKVFILYFLMMETSHHWGPITVAGERTATHFRYMGEVPCWLLVITFALLPACWLLAAYRHRKRSLDCSKCGYNLTGNTSGVCPECGTKIKPTSPPTPVSVGSSKMTPRIP